MGNGPAISTSITENETNALRELAVRADVLETGSAYGYSAIAMGLVAKSVVAVDPHIAHGSYGAMSANLGAYGVSDRVEIRRQFSMDALPQLVAEGRRFDLIFIDGDHTANGVQFDIEHALMLIRPQGVIAVHDVLETCCCSDVGPTTDRIMADHPAGGVYEIVDTMAVFEL